MRTGIYALVAVVAVLVGLGIGYLQWGTQIADLNQQVQQQRSELNYRITEMEGRLKAAEDTCSPRSRHPQGPGRRTPPNSTTEVSATARSLEKRRV